MVHFIIGRSGSGKTHYIREQLQKNDGSHILMVPEQHSFESERALVEMNKGKGLSDQSEVLSFSRLCDRVFALYGGGVSCQFDAAMQTVIMGRALQNISDKLSLFKKSSQNPEFVKSVISFYNEMKNSGIDVADISRTADQISDLHLSYKLKDLTEIFSYYEALAGECFSDKNDRLKVLADKLKEYPFFKEKTVYFDAFKSFTGMQLKIIELIMCQADEVCFTLCTDNLTVKGPADIFYMVKLTFDQLNRIAAKNGIRVASPVYLENAMQNRPEEIKATEKILSGYSFDDFQGKADNVVICRAKDKFEECDFVAREICKMVRDEGYRFRDITVISGDDELYAPRLKSAFERCDIPYFMDQRRPLDCQPITVALKRLIDLVDGAFSTETLLSLLKTGITDIAEQDVYLLENYCYLWDLKGKDLTVPFSLNPDGAREEMSDKASLKLKQLETLRQRVVLPIEQLKNKIENQNTSKEFAKAIYEYFIEINANENIKNMANEVENEGDIDTAEDLRRSFGIFIDILDKSALALEKETLNFRQYRDLLSLIVDSLDMGSLPQGLDEVAICSSHRSRPANPKCVFIVGANDGVFPAIPTEGGIFNRSDRQKLIRENLPLADLNQTALSEENYLFYLAVCCSSQKLYITYSEVGSEGLPLIPCAMAQQISEKIKNCVKYNFSDYSKSGEIPVGLETKQGALELLSLIAKDGTSTTDALVKYFDGHPERGSDTLKNLLEPVDLSIESKYAKELYGNRITVSPTALDSFHKCSFNYFCKYGLKAYPREQISIDSAMRGTIIHSVLENLVNEYKETAFKKYDSKQLKSCGMELVDKYVEEYLGGYQNKSQVFISEINSIKKALEYIVEYMALELSGGKFVPLKCELNLNHDGDIHPKEIILSGGGTISVKGIVDRLDAYEKDGKTYLRVVDYKTGQKDLEIGDVYCGIGLQMFVYLFTIVDSGKFGKNAVPGGVLYFPARAEALGRDRKPGKKMKGVVLNDPNVIEASNHDFMPYSFKKDMDFTASSWVGTEMFFVKTKEKIENLLKNMGDSLQSGYISAHATNPKGGDACKYCDYISVCPHGKTLPNNSVPEVTADIKKIILEGCDYDEAFTDTATTEGD